MNPPDISQQPKYIPANLGRLGEDLVADWLRSQGWAILHQRWRCRFGELDVVAQSQLTVAFVEVKTRSKGNWDDDGLSAITPAKQAKLWQAAQLFLIKHPDLAELPCRFDVALVSCRAIKKRAQQHSTGSLLSTSINLKTLKDPGFTQTIAGHHLTLHRYIQEAFVL